MFLFFRYFFIFHQFHQNIGRAVSRFSPFYTLLCCVHSTKGCIRLRRSVNNTHLITIYFAWGDLVACGYAREEICF